MFQSNVVAEAVSLGLNAAERNIAINGYPNSFLDNLVALTKNALDTSVQPIDSAGNRGDRTWALADIPDQTHCAFTDEAVRNVAKVVSSNMHVVRTDTIPLIRRAMDDLSKVINPDIPYAYRRRAVVPVAFHPIWQSEYIQDIASSYADGNAAGQVPSGLVLSPEDEQYQDFMALSRTGLSSVDKMLENLLGGYESRELQDMFRSVFTDGHLPAVAGPESLTGEWVNQVVLMHVWSQNMADMMPSKSAHNMHSYADGIMSVLKRTGHLIWNINRLRANCAEGNIVVLAYRGDETFVHSDIYTQWLKAGGSPEIILGSSLLTGQLRPVTGTELLANGAVLLEKWNSYVSMTSRSEQENLNAMARVELFKIVRVIADERKAENLLGCYDEVMDRLNAAIALLPTNFIREPYCYVRDVVLATFYTGSDVPLYVAAMDEIECDDDDLPEEDIVVLATINYMTDWMCKLLTLRSGR